MKRVMYLILALFLVTGLVACQPEESETFDPQAYLLEASSTLDLVDETMGNLLLPTSFVYEEKTIELTWYTSNPAVITTTGAVFRPTYDKGDVVVTLTALLTFEGTQFSTTFNVNVLKLDREIYYTVTFDTMGGSLVNPTQVKESTKLVSPTTPSRVGYTFLNWRLDTINGAIFDFNTFITSDITLVAEWQKDEVVVNYLDILYLNDLHGSIEKGTEELGLAYIANYVNYHRNQNPDGVVLLAGGDMFQGSALSNYYQGRSTLEIMNAMGFDAMTLGNHEFDWGIDVVTNYFDGVASNGEADFPLLGANVYYEGTQTIVEHIDPYTIITRVISKLV